MLAALASEAGRLWRVRADAAVPPIRPGTADCVAALAVLHHLADPVMALRAWAALLRPGGVLLVQDLLDRRGWRALPVNALALFAALPSRARALFTPAHRALRAAYTAHGTGERYLTLAAAGALPAAAGLAGARVREHLGWRYSLVWQKPGAGVGAPDSFMCPSEASKKMPWFFAGTSGADPGILPLGRADVLSRFPEMRPYRPDLT